MIKRMTATRILCFVGSPDSEEMDALSRLYAGGCIEALASDPRFDFTLVHIAPDGRWRTPVMLADLNSAAPLALDEIIRWIAGQPFDIALPQLFCQTGMTSIRALIELIDLPYLGNRPMQMALTANKAMARAIVAAAGVAVPEGVTILRGKDPALAAEIPMPVIVKPVAADNSDGVTLVRRPAELAGALEAAWAHDGDALVERFIPPGRELRCAVIERGGQLVCLPPEEYPVDPQARPIRTKADKLSYNADGSLRLEAKRAVDAWIVSTKDPAVPALHRAALTCFAALGCRQYGLFDFRLDEDGKIFFLEAGLYCSFSPQSVIPTMAYMSGITLGDLLETMIAEAL